jgi:hypothetical protein
MATARLAAMTTIADAERLNRALGDFGGFATILSDREDLFCNDLSEWIIIALNQMQSLQRLSVGLAQPLDLVGCKTRAFQQRRMRMNASPGTTRAEGAASYRMLRSESVQKI